MPWCFAGDPGVCAGDPGVCAGDPGDTILDISLCTQLLQCNYELYKQIQFTFILRLL